MTLGQLCNALWDSRSRPVVIQPGIEPGSVVTPLALRCSAYDRCATLESFNIHIQHLCFTGQTSRLNVLTMSVLLLVWRLKTVNKVALTQYAFLLSFFLSLSLFSVAIFPRRRKRSEEDVPWEEPWPQVPQICFEPLHTAYRCLDQEVYMHPNLSR